MTHRWHLLCAVPAALVALWAFSQGASGVAVAGLGLAAVVCPITMGIVMWLLMRQSPTPNTHDHIAHDRGPDHHHVGADR